MKNNSPDNDSVDVWFIQHSIHNEFLATEVFTLPSPSLIVWEAAATSTGQSYSNTDCRFEIN